MPNPNYSQGVEYWCELNLSDLDYDSDPCLLQPTIKKCRQCVYFKKQDYDLVLRREDQKHLIGGR